MKFLKLLFSRFTLVVLAIALQLAAIVAAMTFFAAYYQVFSIVSATLSVILILVIINRDMDCEAKLPWCILATVVPIVGLITYICFSRNFASRKERKMFEKLPQATLADSHPNAPAKYLGQISYLRCSGAPCFSDTDSKYFECGEKFYEDILKELEKAEKFIFMEYFIVEHGKMLDSILQILKRKVVEGVEVRLLYDDLGSLPHVRHSFCKRVQKMGIDCVKFAPLRPIASTVYNNRDHRKITVIDGKIGYMGGNNLSDEYINETHPFGYWKDSAVKLCGNAVSSLTTMFLQMFDMASERTDGFDKYILPTSADAPVNCGIVVPFGDGPRPLYKEQIAKSVYLNLINQAVHDLYITTPYLIVDDGFILSLCNAARRGVDVRIVIPGTPDKPAVYAMTKQSCRKLIAAGVKVYTYTRGFIHAKSIVADGIAGVVGTINIDYRSFVHHYECGVYMYDTAAVRELYADLIFTCGTSELQPTSPKLKLWEKIVCVVGHLFRPLL